MAAPNLCSADSSNLEAALTCLACGYSPFPVQNKVPMVKWEKYQKEPPTDEQVTQWWSKWPDAGIAIATGAVSGVVVVDVDKV